jgi:hypothetical protein
MLSLAQTRGVVSAAMVGMLLLPLAGGSPSAPSRAPGGTASSLPDLSGMVWLSGDTFLAVHDAKNDAEERGRPRVSLVRTATTPTGVTWRPLHVRWPSPLGPSNDLESAARIPGTRKVLLLESGDDGSAFQRIFLGTPTERRLRIEETVRWPVPVWNVEGSAVARLGKRLVFIYAERNQGSASTDVRWARMRLDPLRFGPFREARLDVPTTLGTNRPVVAIDVGPDGSVVVAAAFDPDNDNGPFASGVFRAGWLQSGPGGRPVFLPEAEPELLVPTNGVKIEAVALRPRPDGATALFYGTDDENYGAVLRQARLP